MAFEKQDLSKSIRDTEGFLKIYDPSFDCQSDVTSIVDDIFDTKTSEANLPHLRSYASFGSSMELKGLLRVNLHYSRQTRSKTKKSKVVNLTPNIYYQTILDINLWMMIWKTFRDYLMPALPTKPI